MTDTPNTSRQSEAIQRYITLGGPGDMDPHEEGDYVRHRDHLAALARAREEARREALTSTRRVAVSAVDGTECDGVDYHSRSCRRCAAQAVVDHIDALLTTPTPQGETKEND